MDRNRSPIVLMGILLLGTVGVVFRTGKVAAPTAAAPGAAAGESSAKDARPKSIPERPDGPLTPLHGYRDIKALPTPDDLTKALWHDRAEFLIATVPDPIDSRFSYRFDAIVDAIQGAIETRGYNLDRFWLPWRPRGDQPKQHDQLAPIFGQSDGPLALHEREPGVMLFRRGTKDSDEPDLLDHRRGTKDPKKPDLLVLFLVGETPVSGLHKVAFARALDFIKAAAGPGRAGGEFRIAGPFFSGSTNSLALAISSWRTLRHPGGDAWTFVIRSGSATKVDVDHLKSAASYTCNTCPLNHPLGIDFRATILPNELVLSGLLEYLVHENLSSGAGQGGEGIALLTESDTAYGELNSRERKLLSDYKVLRMEFPFHISQVRIAYNQGPSSAREGLPGLPRTLSRLKIPFDETGRPRDAVPSLSPDMTSTVDEFVLSRILSTISREGFRHVGILATDTRDVIFLAGLIREFCPDVQLFTTEGDLLLAHPDYSGQLRGMVVASSYPLFSTSQSWTTPYRGDSSRHLFAHHADQGYYNATIALFLRSGADAEESELLDYGTPFQWIDPECLAKGMANLRPPLWISVVGERGLWPVQAKMPTTEEGRKIYQRYVMNAATPRPDLPAAKVAGLHRAPDTRAAAPGLWARGRVPRFTWQWGAPFLAFSALILAALGFNLRACYRPGRADPFPDNSVLGRITAALRPRLDPALRVQQEAYLALGLAALLSYYVYLARPSFLPPFEPAFDGTWNGIFSGCARAGAILTVAATAFVLLARLACTLASGTGRTRKGRGALIGAAAALALILTGAIWLVAWKVDIPRGAPGGESRWLLRRLAFERVVSLSTGISPVPPVILLGLATAGWFLCELRRLTPLDRPHARTPDLGPAVVGAVQRLESVLRTPCPATNRDAPFHMGIVVMALGTLHLIQRSIPPPDGPTYGRVVLTAFVLTSLAIVTTFYRFLLVWRGVKGLLAELGRLPMLRTFKRLPPIVSRTFGRYLDHKGAPTAIRPLLLRQWRAFSGSNRESPDDQAVAQDVSMALISLQDHWRDATLGAAYGDPTADEKADKAGPGEPTPPPAAQVAEDFVALWLIGLVARYTRQMANLARFLTVGPLLLLLTVASYPFQPQRFLLVYLGVIILAVVTGLISAYVTLDRDEWLGRVSGTDSGRVTLDQTFLSSVLTYALPLLGVVASQFPDLMDLLSSWTAPLAGTLK